MYKTQGFLRNIKKILWIVITIAACFVWGLVVMAIVALIKAIAKSGSSWGTIDNVGTFFMIIGFIALIILSVIMWNKIESQCPVCKKLGAMCYLKEEIIAEKDVNVPISLHRKNQKGEIIDTYQQYVSGVRKTFRTTYKCSYCNHIETRTYTKDIANI